jgi:hypothetical protein
MTGSAVLGLVVGLIFVFGLLAVFSSAVCEAIASSLQMRAKYLLRGLRTMLDETVTGKGTPIYPDMAAAGAPVAALATMADHLGILHALTLDPAKTAPAAKKVNDLAIAANTSGADVTSARHAVQELPGGLTVALFGHPLVQSLQTRRVRLGTARLRNPSYLSARLFARVLVDMLVPDSSGETTLTQVAKTIANLPDRVPAKKSLLALVKRAEGNIDRFEALLEQWYDEHMDRVSGWYKRWTRVMLAVVGLVIAVAANIDTFQVARSLYTDQPLRAAVLSQVSEGRLCANQPDPVQRRAARATRSPSSTQAACPYGGRCTASAARVSS